MVWAKAGNITLGSAGDTMNVSGFTASKFNNYLTHAIDNGSGIGTTLTLDGVGGTSYVLRYSENGTEGTRINQASWVLRFNANDQFDVGYICNIAGEEKLMIGWHVARTTAGAGTSPNRSEFVAKFVQNSQFTQITNTNDQNGDFDTSSNLTILGSEGGLKTKPTNVQDNSILVEKDTGNRYWFESESSETLSQETESGTGELFNDVEIVAQKFTSGSSKIGKKVSSVAFYLKRNTSTIGSTNLQCFVGAGNQSSAVAYGTLPATSLTTSYAWYTFTPSVAGTERTLVADDRIMIRWADGSTTSDAVRMASDQSGNNPLANETGQYSSNDGSSFTDRSFDYMYKIISTTPATWTMEPTYETDFSTNKGWVSNDTAKMNVNTSTSVFDFTSIRNGSAATAYKALSKTASNDKWLLRFRYNMSSSNNNDARLFIGLSSTTGNYGSTEDWLGIIIASSSGHNLWAIRGYDGVAVTIGSYDSFALTPVTGTNYYVELIRLSATSFKLNLYSDSTYSTLLDSVTHTIPSTLVGLSYLKIMNMNNDSAGYSMTGVIDDISFYNGVTSL